SSSLPPSPPYSSIHSMQVLRSSSKQPVSDRLHDSSTAAHSSLVMSAVYSFGSITLRHGPQSSSNCSGVIRSRTASAMAAYPAATSAAGLAASLAAYMAAASAASLAAYMAAASAASLASQAAQVSQASQAAPSSRASSAVSRPARSTRAATAAPFG